MITALCALLLSTFMGMGGPASFGGYFGYILCCLPYMWDWLISMRTAYKAVNQPASSATVEEIPTNEEHFISMNNQDLGAEHSSTR